MHTAPEITGQLDKSGIMNETVRQMNHILAATKSAAASQEGSSGVET